MVSEYCSFNLLAAPFCSKNIRAKHEKAVTRIVVTITCRVLTSWLVRNVLQKEVGQNKMKQFVSTVLSLP